MRFPQTLSADELQKYHQVVTHSTELRSHFDLMLWLQGEMQEYLPHDILVAGWGSFEHKEIEFDIISPITGVRSRFADRESMTELLRGLFEKWLHFKKRPYILKSGLNGFMPHGHEKSDTVNNALRSMHWSMVHGIVDKRGKHECLYAAFSASKPPAENQLSVLAAVMPYIDTALRQITHLPKQVIMTVQDAGANVASRVDINDLSGLSQRETEVLQWVAKGKTNIEIASILQISAFTVKNHMQRVLQKLNVNNRAQAVSKISPNERHVQT
jgi:transcriptional regulator EpsA